MGINQPTTVTSYSRLHLGLHDCGYATDRVFGGVGISFEGFPTTAVARQSEETSVTFPADSNPSERTIETASALLSRLTPLIGEVAVDVTSLAPEHLGFGSKTSLLLAIAHSAVIASGMRNEVSREELVKLTERGGTSGVGVNTFWTGGLVADAGHYASKKNRHFAPSSARGAQGVSPVVSRVDMPDDWRVQLFYDPNFEPIEGAREREIFTSLMPLPEIEILRAMAATYHGVIPAVRTHKLDQLADALQDLNSTGMKAHEVDLQTDATRAFLNEGWDTGIAAGLTSFGPTVYVINEAGTPTIEQTNELASSHGLASLGMHAFDNHGATVR